MAGVICWLNASWHLLVSTKATHLAGQHKQCVLLPSGDFLVGSQDAWHLADWAVGQLWQLFLLDVDRCRSEYPKLLRHVPVDCHVTL